MNKFLLSLFLLFGSIALAFAADPAGKSNGIYGTVQAVGLDGQTRALSEGADFYSGDRITTARGSSVLLQFNDGTRFVLGQNATIRVRNFVYTANADRDVFDMQMIKGAFRFFSGLIAKRRPQSMSVGLTNVGTIGVRGTHVVGEVGDESATVIMMPPEEDPNQRTSIEVYNTFGSVYIDQPEYGTTIPDAHSPPSPPRRMQMNMINNIVRSIQAIQSMPRIPVMPPTMHHHWP